MPNNFPSWVNGSAQSSVSVMDRAIAYGDGLFETIRIKPKPVLAELHFSRMSDGLSRLNIAASLSDIQSQFQCYSDQFNPGLIKIIVSRGVGGRGYAEPESPNPAVIIQGFDLPSYDPAWADSGVDLFQCRTTLTINPVLQGVKHLNRLEQVLARNEFSSNDYQEGLMSFNGSLVEGTMSNLFYVNDGQLHTPCLDQCAVNGTMQRYIIENCADIVGQVKEVSEVTIDTLITAEEVFVCNSVFGIWPVKSLMGKPINVSSAGVVKSLQQNIQSLFS